MEKVIELKECLVDLLFEEYKINAFRNNLESIGITLPEYLHVDNSSLVIDIIGFPRKDYTKAGTEGFGKLYDRGELTDTYYYKLDKLYGKDKFIVKKGKMYFEESNKVEIKKGLSKIVDWLYLKYDKYQKQVKKKQ